MKYLKMSNLFCSRQTRFDLLMVDKRVIRVKLTNSSFHKIAVYIKMREKLYRIIQWILYTIKAMLGNRQLLYSPI